MLLNSKSREKRRNKQNYNFSQFSFHFHQQLTSKVHPMQPWKEVHVTDEVHGNLLSGGE